MQFSTGCFCALLIAVAACAAPAPPPPPPAAAAAKSVEHGTILAIRPVPPESPQTARVLLTRLGELPPATAHSAEYIIRDQDGATISVVQTDLDGARQGDRVSILRGARTSIMDRIASPQGD